jgi:glutamate synthase domain-containing protein 2
MAAISVPLLSKIDPVEGSGEPGGTSSSPVGTMQTVGIP